MISKEALEKYKEIYKKKFGKEISDQEALRQAISLLNLCRIVYGFALSTKTKTKIVNKEIK